jgi:hypothetical protein
MQVSTTATTDISFLQQMLMSAIENVAVKIRVLFSSSLVYRRSCRYRHIQEAPNLSPSTVRLDVIVDLIRGAAIFLDHHLFFSSPVVGTTNPQTFNQGLLLLSRLAHLAPESVLHNVMPIFTFMGSNVFHRDDEYSFNVIRQVRICFRPHVAVIDEESSDCKQHCAHHGWNPDVSKYFWSGALYQLQGLLTSIHGCGKSYPSSPS